MWKTRNWNLRDQAISSDTCKVKTQICLIPLICLVSSGIKSNWIVQSSHFLDGYIHCEHCLFSLRIHVYHCSMSIDWVPYHIPDTGGHSTEQEHNLGWRYSSVLESLPSMSKVLGSISKQQWWKKLTRTTWWHALWRKTKQEEERRDVFQFLGWKEGWKQWVEF